MKTREEKKENVFCFLFFFFVGGAFCFVFMKMQATKDNIEKLQTGLDDLRYFQTQKQEHWSTALPPRVSFPTLGSEVKHHSTHTHSHKVTHTHTHWHTLIHLSNHASSSS